MAPPSKHHVFSMDYIVPYGRLFKCMACVGTSGQPLEPLSASEMAKHVNRDGGRHLSRIQNLKLGGKGDRNEPELTANTLNTEEPEVDDPNSRLEHTQNDRPTPPPHLLSSGTWSDALPVPTYNFFQDNAYGSADPDTPAVAFPDGGFELPSETARGGDRAPTDARSNPYDDTTYSPYKSKQIFLTHSLFNAPAIRYSDEQKAAILDWANEMGTENVPTLYQLKKCDERINSLMDDSSAHMLKTPSGEVFYVNKLSTMLKQDFSNPNVRNFLEFFPHEHDRHVSEMWHGDKMVHGESPDQLTPMISNGQQSFFVNELALLEDGSYFLPKMFLKCQGELSARGHRVLPTTETNSSTYDLDDGSTTTCPVSSLRLNCIGLGALISKSWMLSNGKSLFELLAPHPLREMARGRKVYSVPYIVFLDDVSGNRSKQWNKHWCCYISNASLPRKKLNERFNIRFMSTSQHVSPLEMLEGICQIFDEAFDEPIVTWDEVDGCEVLVRPYIHVISGDNPAQAEECSTCGLRSNLLCRTCMAGGSRAFRVTSEGFLRMIQEGVPRTPIATIKYIKEQFNIAFTSKSAQKLQDHQRDSGIKDSLAQPHLDLIIKRRQELQRDTPQLMSVISQQLKDEYFEQNQALRMNPLLSLRGFDVHQDTPTETLHTILLGIAKYLWTESVGQMDKRKSFGLFSTRLRSVSVSGLATGPVPGYILSNRGSLNGKHFKILIQTAPFCLHNLIDNGVLDAWIALGRLTVFAWYPTIDNIDEYTVEFKAAIDDFLYTAAKHLPALIVQKAKVHLLVHMPFFVRRFGPLLGPSSERYESFNGVFRSASVHSNRQAPSRDIARTFATFDMVKHIISGGYWFDSHTNRYVCAGKGIAELHQASTFTQRLLGTKSHARVDFRLSSIHPVVGDWSGVAPAGVECPDALLAGTKFHRIGGVFAQDGDRIASGMNVIYHTGDLRLNLGRVDDIFLSTVDTGFSSTSFAVVRIYKWIELDETVQMPAVRLESQLIAVATTNILCEINLQHRCAKLGCTDSSTRPIQHERQDTGMTQPAIQHVEDLNYIVNTFALHNCKFVRQLVTTHSAAPALLQSPQNYAVIRSTAVATLESKAELKHGELDTGEGLRPSVAKPGRNPIPVSQKQPAQKQTDQMDSGNKPPMHAGPSNLKRRKLNNTPVQHSTSTGLLSTIPPSSATPVDNSSSSSLYSAEHSPAWRAVWSHEEKRFYFRNNITGVTTQSLRDPDHVQ